MTSVNSNFLKLQSNYLFAEIARKVASFKEANPEKRVISLGIGDVTRPLVPAVVAALHKAVDDMGEASSFHGYGPEQGYAFLRETIAQHDYKARGVDLSPDEVFVSDGAKSDVGNFQELFAAESIVAVTDPVYPVYVDSNAMRAVLANLRAISGTGLCTCPALRKTTLCRTFPKPGPTSSICATPTTPRARCFRARPFRAG